MDVLIEKKDNDDIVKQALEDWKASNEYFDKDRKESLQDIKFEDGDQYPDDVRSEREGNGKPCLTFNSLPQFVHRVVNDARQNKVSIKAIPQEDGDKETAKIIEGLIRSIQKDSKAHVAYDNALSDAVKCGIGFIRVLSEYENNNSFNQVIKIKHIPNPLSVYIDPASSEYDCSDARFFIITEDIPRKTYESLYPESAITSFDSYGSGDHLKEWVNDQIIRVAEYFVKTKEKKTLYLMSNGKTILKDDYDKIKNSINETLVITRERETEIDVVKWYKINGNEILEEKEWPSEHIGIVPVFGEDYWIENQRHWRGLIRFARDPQYMYNYLWSAEIEFIKTRIKAPVIAPQGSFEGYEDKWASSNTKNWPYLEYKLVYDRNGNRTEAPREQMMDMTPSGTVNAKMGAREELKSTTGIYDASLGNSSNETSGRAILARQRQGDNSTYHYVDNLSRSIEYLGKILVDMIPKIYDTERTVRILGDDESEKVVKLYSQNEDGYIYDISNGRYDVEIITGPSFASKRQESAEAMMQMLQNAPQQAEKIMDLVVQNMDWPNADKISERLKKFMPPEIVGVDQDDPMAEDMATKELLQAKEMLDQQSQMLDLQEQKLNELVSQNQELSDKISFDMQKEIINRETILDKEKIISEREIQKELIRTKSNIESQTIASQGEIKEEVIQAQSDALLSQSNNQSQSFDSIINSINKMNEKINFLEKSLSVQNAPMMSLPVVSQGIPRGVTP